MTSLPRAEIAHLFEPYSRYAAVYDRIGQREFGERIAAATLHYLAGQGVTPGSALDLACGTGASTCVLAAAGIDVTAIDRSPDMVQLTQAALAERGLRAAVTVADMRGFEPGRPVDLVTCFYDAMNYLAEDGDLRRVCERAYAALAPGGRFIFDLNTRAKFEQGWDEACYVATDQPTLFGVYRSWFEPETGLSPLVLTFFHREPGAATWQRFDEEHVERAFPLETVADVLRAAGFVVDDLRDYADRSARFGAAGSEASHRVVFVARRPEVEAER